MIAKSTQDFGKESKKSNTSPKNIFLKGKFLSWILLCLIDLEIVFVISCLATLRFIKLIFSQNIDYTKVKSTFCDSFCNRSILLKQKVKNTKTGYA